VNVIQHVVIRGRVQGVGYRAWAEWTALQEDVEGWVRNRRDGSVEAVFAGSAEAVEAMVDACRRGPRGARVERVDAQDVSSDMLAARHSGERFSVLPTA